MRKALVFRMHENSSKEFSAQKIAKNKSNFLMTQNASEFRALNQRRLKKWGISI